MSLTGIYRETQLPVPDGQSEQLQIDGYGNLRVAIEGSLSVSGGATEAKQDTGNTSLSSIDTKLTGVATAANQTTANASLSSIDTKTSNIALEATSQLILAKLSSLGPWIDRAAITVDVEPTVTQLPSYACTELKVIADRANTKVIYFGGSTVSSTNSQDLAAREVEIVTQITNSNQFYVTAAAGDTGQKLRIQTR